MRGDSGVRPALRAASSGATFSNAKLPAWRRKSSCSEALSSPHGSLCGVGGGLGEAARSAGRTNVRRATFGRESVCAQSRTRLPSARTQGGRRDRAGAWLSGGAEIFLSDRTSPARLREMLRENPSIGNLSSYLLLPPGWCQQSTNTGQRRSHDNGDVLGL